MKIVNILGGLGNQMFEYAMYIALKDAHPDEEIYCCTRCFNGYGLHNGYELDRIFNIRVKEASLKQLALLAYPFFNYTTWRIMCHWLPHRSKSMTKGTTQTPFIYEEVTRQDSVFYDFYWQNEKYFKQVREKILREFVFPPFLDKNNLELVNDIQKEISVSCHIRRGDYLKEPEMCVCTPLYYARAITYMNEVVNPTMYVVFSDDILWCKENIQGLVGSDKKIVFVDWNKGENSFRDMQLMSLCKHNIIANSSFSWWGAWLNQNISKTVVAPETWMNKPLVNDPLCEDWIKLKSKIV